MTSTPRSEHDDSLNESWVELQYGQQASLHEPLLSLGSGGNANGGSSTPYSTGSGGGGGRPGGTIQFGTNMEKLLMEAQRESRNASREGSQGGSPKGPHSPVLSSNPSAPGSVYSNGSGEKQMVPGLMGQAEGATGRGENWIWDWSSRPEPLPPKEFRFKHPDKTGLSIRKTKAMRSNFLSAEILSVFIPSMILTNLFALGIGVFIGLRIAAPKSS